LFSGAAGELLWNKLADHGLDRGDFFITNGVKCRPEFNTTPTLKQVRTCTTEYLVPEIEAIKPRFGLALGNVGLMATRHKKGITKFSGAVYEWQGVKFVACLHPAAVLRNPRYTSQFDQALVVFKRLVYDEAGVPSTNIVIVNDKESLKKLVARLRKAKEGAIDTETDGDKPPKGRFKGGGLAWWDPSWMLVSIQLTIRAGGAYVIPLWHKESRWKDPQRVVNILKPYLESPDIEWTLQNGKYDEHVLRRVGVSIFTSFDTMGAEYALDENNYKGLGVLAQKYLAAPDYKEMIDKSHMRDADLELLAEYGGRDSDYTFRLKGPQRLRMHQDGLAETLYNEILMPAVRTLTSMEEVGFPIHRKKFAHRQKQVYRKIASQMKAIDKFVPDSLSPINLNSPKQIGQLLFDHLDFPIHKTTKSGAPSTSEGVLVRLNDVDDTGIIDLILNYRKWKLYESRYFTSWEYFMDDRGIIHPGYKPFHTVTGRLSCENPNMQQVPRNPFVRGLVGGRKGWTVVEADYSQAELRIAAHISQDRAMLRAYNTGRDIHMETAMAITGKAPPEISSEERKMAKSVNFGFLYGMGANKYVEYSKENFNLDVSIEEAKRFRATFFDRYRKLQAWHQRQRMAAQRRGWVVSPIGRRRRLWDIDSTNESVRAEAERQAINSPVQSMASDMMLLAMSILHERPSYNVARLFGTVHDSILFLIRDEAVDDTIPIIKEVMENLPLEV
jgi:DNA polymerase-1